MATIEERPGVDVISYRVYWRNGGRRGRKQSVTTNSAKRAETVKAFVEDRHHRITSAEVYKAVFPAKERADDVPTLAEFSRTWLASKTDIQPDTRDDYRRAIARWVLPRLGEYRVSAITPEAVTEWVVWLAGRESARGTPIAAGTVRHAHALLHSLLGGAVPRWLAANPAHAPHGSRKGTPGLPKYVQYEATFLEYAEADLVLAHCAPQIHDLVFVALRTGLRLGELLALRVQDVDLDPTGPTISVKRALKNDGTFGPPKSKRSRRTISLSPKTATVLAERVKGRGRSALVFPSPEGLVWAKQNLNRRYWLPAVAAAQRCPIHPPQLPAKPRRGPRRRYRSDEVSTCDCAGRLHKTPRLHDLRHTHASWLIALHEDLFTVSRRLGHEDVSTTANIYGHLLKHGDGGRLRDMDERAA